MKLHRVRPGRVPRVGAPVPMELRCIPFPVHGCVYSPGSSPNPVLLEFAWILHHIVMIDHFQTFSLSVKWSRGKIQASIYGLVLLVTSPHPGAYPESPRKLQGFWEPCSRNQGQRPIFSIISHVFKKVTKLK